MKDYRSDINRIIHDIKKTSGWQPGKIPFDSRKMGLVSENVACLDGLPVRRKIFVFRSNGCHWAKKNGCSMCGYFRETTGERGIVSVDDYVAQLERELQLTDFAEFPVLCLFTAGSFLDEWEFPWEAAQEVFKLLGKQRHLKKVIIESCAEYVDEMKLERLRELIGDKTVEVGIGLETSDQYVLRNCVNKDFTLEEYERAVKVITKYFRVLSYVLIKPPFLTERESLDLAVQTGRYALEQGSHAVSFEPMYVERYTLIDFLFREGYLYKEETYRPPWLWTAFAAVDQLRPFASEFPGCEIRIGNSDELPRPYHLARNCDLCSDRASLLIEGYNQTYDFGPLRNFDCSCKKDWAMDLAENATPVQLPDRIESFVCAYAAKARELPCLVL
jgi:radical SAM enzyme (TIGR01210 family)